MAGHEAKKRLSLLELCLTDDHHPEDYEASVEFLKTLPEEQVIEIRYRHFKELQKPGGGLSTMDFCTLGMFIIGWWARMNMLVIWLSIYR